MRKVSKNTTKQSKRNKFDRKQFESETKGMTQSQIFEYLKMNAKEKEEFLKILRQSISSIPLTGKQDGRDKTMDKTLANANAKALSEISLEITNQVSVLVQNLRGKPLMPMPPTSLQ